MVDYPALSGIDDPSQVRLALVVNKDIAHVPLNTLMDVLGFQPLDADLTSWAGVTRATGFDTFAATPSSANLAALVTNELGADQLLFGTPFVTSTPTLIGFGTPSAVSYFSRRVGDILHIRCKFTSGTSTAVEARVPLLLNGVAVNSDATKVASIQLAGPAIPSFVSASSYYMLIESNVGYLTFGVQSAGRAALTKVIATLVAASGDTISFTAEVPISGW